MFIVQTTGRKEYLLRKNTVNPWPLEETLPVDMRYEREIMPLMRCMLTAGDWLYIPAGYWHMGQADETALSLAIGVMSHTAIEVLDVLRTKCLESIRWRQRLPVGGAARLGDDVVREQLRELLKDLASDAQLMMSSDDFVAEVLRQLQCSESPDAPRA